MKKNDLLVWAIYVVGVSVVSLVISLLISWVSGEQRYDDVVLRSIFMGLGLGTVFYFWDNRKSKKKK